MKDLLDFWPGAKTYIVIGLAAALWAAFQFGFVDGDQFGSGLTILGIIGGGTLAMKIDRLRPGGGANLLLVGLIGASMLSMGCQTISYDGATAERIAVEEAARVTVAGSPIAEEECEPLGDFGDAMANSSGSEWVMAWLWTDESQTEPRLIAAEAHRQLTGCTILQQRGASGATADRLRSVLNDFWTRVGLNVGPGAVQ